MDVRGFARPHFYHPALKIATLIGLLYLFFVSIALMSSSIKLFGRGFAEGLLVTTSNPFNGLLIGIVVTSLVQSSSTTTSMVVGLVAGGALTLEGAIPIIMGANVGTSVTNTLVSLAQIGRAEEFKRSFAAATVHDFFNIIVIAIFFPIQVTTDFFGIVAGRLTTIFSGIGGMTFTSPLKAVTAPAVHLLENISGESGTISLLVALMLLFGSLRYLVIILRSLIIGKVESFFHDTVFRNEGRALIVGVILTMIVQSSSITTSLVVPLAGAGILTLRQIFPFTLGANAGTTVTAILASLVTGSVIAVAAAFSHLVFNVLGIILIWPMRQVPIFLAETLAIWGARYRFLPLVYVAVVFFLIPVSGIYLGG